MRLTSWPGVHRGVGRHIEVYGPEGVKHFYLSLFICEILYTLTLCLTKFSIMLFFLRIFGKTSIRIPIYILAMIVTGWAVSVVSSKADLHSSKRMLSFAQLGCYNHFSMQSRSGLCKFTSTTHIVPRMISSEEQALSS